MMGIIPAKLSLNDAEAREMVESMFGAAEDSQPLKKWTSDPQKV
jgi:hypothetical protein